MLDYFDDLAENNDRAWFAANKPRYQEQVSDPLHSIALALEPTFGPIKHFRPYRDTRFSSDKSPIKEQASFVTREGGMFYFQVSGAGAMVAGGDYQPDATRLARFRALVDDPAGAKAVHRLLAALERDGFALADWGRLRSAPRGYTSDHPQIELLRQKSLAVMCEVGTPDWLFTSDAARHIGALWAKIRPWNDLLRQKAPAA